MIYLYPYREGSRSVAALREEMDNLRVIRRENSRFKGDKNKIVINWGCTEMTNEELEKCALLNKPDAVKIASNKLTFFEKCKGIVPIPDFTEDKDEAKKWLDEGRVVFGRSVLNGHSGEGIVEFDNQAVWETYHIDYRNTFPLYVLYIPKRDEYRIHVFNGKVIDVQQKRASRSGTPNWRVRNHNNGFIFARENVNVPQQLLDDAVKAVEVCGLDFGAVDVIWNEYRQQGYILEINTAPGLEGETKKKYTNSIQDILDTITEDDVRLFGDAIPYSGNGRDVVSSRPAWEPIFTVSTNSNSTS